MTGIVSTMLCGIAYMHLMDTAALNDTVQRLYRGRSCDINPNSL